MSSPLILIAFNHEPPAKLLIDYLKSQNIDAYYVVDESAGGHGIALSHAEDFPKAKVLAEEFLKDPGNQRYQRAAWEHGDQLHHNTSSGISAFRRLFNFTNTPFTSFIFVLCLISFGLSLLGWFPQVRGALQFVSYDFMAETSQWWRIITPAFLHFSPLHIVFNLLWWWMLGSQIEQKFGSSTLLLLFLTSAIASNVSQYLVSGPNFGGLSGVVYAVVGFVWWVGWLRPSWGISLPKPVVGFLLIWLVLGYADLLWVQMANTAHTMGLVSGCLFALLITCLKERQP